MRAYASAWRGIPRADPKGERGPPGPGDCVPLSLVLFVDGGTATPLADQDGGICTPYATIQQALDAIGVPADADAQAEGWSILVVGGTYTENLVVPAKRRIWINALGPVTIDGTVAWAVNGAGIPGTSVPHLEFGGFASGVSIASTQAGNFEITDDVTITDGGVATTVAVVAFDRDVLQGDLIGSGLDESTFVHLYFASNTVVGAITSDRFAVIDALASVFVGLVNVLLINHAEDSVFIAGATIAVTGGPMTDCQFGPAAVLTGPGDFVLDGGSMGWLRLAAGTLVGTAVDRVDLPYEPSETTAIDITVDPARPVVFVTALPRTITLPAAPELDDECKVKDAAGGAAVNNITVDGGAFNIDGAATQAIATNYGAMYFKFNGTEWSTI